MRKSVRINSFVLQMRLRVKGKVDSNVDRWWWIIYNISSLQGSHMKQPYCWLYLQWWNHCNVPKILDNRMDAPFCETHTTSIDLQAVIIQDSIQHLWNDYGPLSFPKKNPGLCRPSSDNEHLDHFLRLCRSPVHTRDCRIGKITGLGWHAVWYQ